MKPIDIIIVTYNRLSYTKRCLEHLLERTKHPYNLIIIDNGSTDGTQKYLLAIQKKIARVKYVMYFGENKGLEYALQEGYKKVDSKYFVTTDNDILCCASRQYGKELYFTDWLTKLSHYMDRYSDFGAIATRPQILYGVGNIFKNPSSIIENNVVGGSLRMIRKIAVDDVGGWDISFKKGGKGLEEWDICSKMRKKGWKVGYTKNLWCYHMFGENWGYEQGKEGERFLKQAPKDEEYNPITMEPKIHHNE